MRERIDSACVTGASSGIGEAFARALARRAARLELVARSTERLQALAAQLERECDVACRVTTCDLSDRAAVTEVARRIAEDPPEVLINNAGFGRYGAFATLPVEAQLAMVDVNMRALVQLSHAFVRAALRRDSGTLIQVASTAGYAPVPFGSVYAATKAFVIHFGEALWEELRGSHLRVLTLCPGFTDTRFAASAGMPPEVVWRGGASPEEVVETALEALASGAPTVVHGRVNRVGGALGRILPRRLLLRKVGGWTRRGLSARSGTSQPQPR